MSKVVQLTTILFCMVVSCSIPSQDKSIIDFPISEIYAWHSLDNGAVLPQSRGMLVNDTSIYILGRSNRTWLQQYGKNNGVLLDSHIRNGNMPEDISNGISLNYSMLDSLFTIFDCKTHILKSYSNDYRLKSSLCLDSLFRTVNGIYRISSDICLVDAPVFFENRFTFHSKICSYNNHTGKIISEYFDFPLDSIVPSELHLTLKEFASAEDGSKVALIYPQSLRLTFLNISDSGNITQIYADDFSVPIKERLPLGFRTVRCTKNYVYISYSDSEADDVVTKIGVWDWSGKPVREICTDNDIMDFAVLNNNSEIYGLINDTENGRQLAKIIPAN